MFRSNDGLEEGIRLLEHLTYINKKAKEAVALGDGTLKEANDTYETLTREYKLLFIATRKKKFI